MIGTEPFTCLPNILTLHFTPGSLIFEMAFFCVAQAGLEFVNNLSALATGILRL